MKMTVESLRALVEDVIAEAKKKKKEEIEESEVRPDAHVRDPKLDFSKPLGAHNVYRQMGVANWGPYTAASGLALDERIYGIKESRLRQAIRGLIDESLRPAKGSVWTPLAPRPASAPNGVWESALRWYDHSGRGLGRVAEQAEEPAVDEKKIGFKKLKAKLAHKKGVKSPGALAASIGRKKYGQAAMTKKSVAGRK